MTPETTRTRRMVAVSKLVDAVSGLVGEIAQKMRQMSVCMSVGIGFDKALKWFVEDGWWRGEGESWERPGGAAGTRGWLEGGRGGGRGSRRAGGRGRVGLRYVEGLEGRALFASMWVSGGVINIVGDTGTHNYVKTVWAVDGSTVTAQVNKLTQVYSSSQINGIRVVAGNAGDEVRLDPRMYRPATITGGNGADVLQGGASGDSISGGVGNDWIDSGGGNDSVAAGDGNDTVWAGWGNDTIDGGAGTDQLSGQDGNDVVIPSAGGDTVTGAVFSTTGVVSSGTSSPSTSGSSPTPPSTPPSTTTTTAPTTVSGSDTGTFGSGGAVINASGLNLKPGQAVFVSALGSKLAHGTAITAQYQWDFGDGQAGYNQLTGFNAAHAYDSPGTYTVTLTVTDEAGTRAVATARVNVAADTRRAIYVAAHGNDGNDGSSPDKAIRTVGRANQLVGNDRRVLFRRGDTFDLTSGLYVGGQDVEVGAYGTGNRPVLRRANASMQEIVAVGLNARDIVVRDLTFDTTTPTDLEKSGAARGVSARGNRLTIRGCEFRNASDAVNANESPTGLLIQDNVAPTVTSIRGYFAWLQGQDLVVLGNKVANCTREHVLRVGGAERVLAAYNDFTNLDRRGAGDAADIAKGCFTIQKGAYIYIAHNVATDGGIGVGPLGGKDGKNDPGGRSTYVVVDGNRLDGVGLTVSPGSEHVSIRNNVVRRDSQEGIWLRPTDNYSENGYYYYTARNIYDLTIANNTVIDNGTSGNLLYVESRGAAGQVTLANNLFVAPNVTAGANRSAAVYINDNQADGAKFLRAVAGNVWENIKTYPYAQGGYFYAYPYWSDSRGYLTPAEWQQFAGASDRYGGAGLNTSTFAPATWSTARSGSSGVAGVFADYWGNARGGLGRPTTAGAVG